jgi:ribose transport system permease protein
MNSIQSTALEPTRYELQKLSTAQKLMRWVPTYGLVFLTLYISNASQFALHHF